MKDKIIEFLHVLSEVFSFKAFFITSIASLLMVIVKYPTTARWVAVIIALLCGVISGFITRELAFFIGVRGVAENTISALLGIIMKDFIQSYVDKLISKYILKSKENEDKNNSTN